MLSLRAIPKVLSRTVRSYYLRELYLNSAEDRLKMIHSACYFLTAIEQTPTPSRVYAVLARAFGNFPVREISRHAIAEATRH